ncbi:hypothetical protein GA0115240_16921, partial [Streptomyces sp. DvalAA-14]
MDRWFVGGQPLPGGGVGGGPGGSGRCAGSKPGRGTELGWR